MFFTLTNLILGFAPGAVLDIVTGAKHCCLREGRRGQLGMQVHFYAYRPLVGMQPFRGPAAVVALRQVRYDEGEVLLDEQPLSPAELEALVAATDFADAGALLTFLRQRSQPFDGQLIYWN